MAMLASSLQLPEANHQPSLPQPHSGTQPGHEPGNQGSPCDHRLQTMGNGPFHVENLEK